MEEMNSCYALLSRTTSLYSYIFWSSGIMDCMLFTFQNRAPFMFKGR